MKNENQDIVGEKYIKDDDDNLAFDDKSKLAAWKCHYEKLLNVEFRRDSNALSEEQPLQRPPIRITNEMVSEALSKMKKGKATGPSGLNVEIILAGGDDIILAITHLINCIIADNKIPDDWCLSYIINCYKGKGDALLRGNYRGLKLLDQVMKNMEHIIATIIRTQVDIDAMQFGFMPGRGTTDAIFIFRQVHEKYLGKHKDLYFASVDLEKVFDLVPRKVLWWALKKFGVDEWLIRTIQVMYTNAKSSVRIDGQFSSWFDVQAGVHQGFVLIPFLFIIAMEALYCHFRTGCPRELLYADDLVITAETLSELLEKFRVWKTNLESKGLRVNVGKTKILVSVHNAPKPVDGSKFPSGVRNNGVGINSIKCHACGFWVHKRCSNIKGPLKPDTDFKCEKCRGEVSNAFIPDSEPVVISGEEIEKASSFCYLGDFVGQCGGCFDATTARTRSARNKFRDLLPILTCRGLSSKSRGYACYAFVLSVLLYASETWAATQEDVIRLNRNDMMIRWICSTKLRDKVPSEELRSRLGLGSIENALRCGRLCWYGHVQRMDHDTWPRKVEKTIVTDNNPRGRPRKT